MLQVKQARRLRTQLSYILFQFLNKMAASVEVLYRRIYLNIKRSCTSGELLGAISEGRKIPFLPR